MRKIIFPEPDFSKLKELYWTLHIEFNIKLFQYAGWEVSFSKDLTFIGNSYQVSYNNKLALFDFGDASAFTAVSPDKNYHRIFKTHVEGTNENPTNVYPWSAISFYDWDRFYSIRESIKYNPTNRLILNNQTAYGNATERRNYVKGLLDDSGYPVDFSITSQVEFWNKGNSCLAYVHVPGFCNFMIDRATIQMMAFGVPVITTQIPEELPQTREHLTPGLHYIECKSDYSDLIEIIAKLQTGDRSTILGAISNHSKILFDLYFSPKSLTNYFDKEMS